MAVVMRMTRTGAKKNPSYRVVVADSRRARDGKFIAVLGTYNPTVEPVEIKLNADMCKEWIAKGAQPTPTARAILEKAGILEKKPCKKVFTKKAEKKVEKKLKLLKPLDTTITKKEISVEQRTKEIKDILRLRGKVDFYSLFSINTREYIVITFLTILNMSKNKELKIIQEDNFSPIIVEGLDYE